MARARMTVASLMIAVFALAIVFAVLRDPSELATSLILLATLAGLAMAGLAAIDRQGASRSFWRGFAVMGWGYMVLASNHWWDGASPRPALPTTTVNAVVYNRFASERVPFVPLAGRLPDAWWADSRSVRIHDELSKPVSMPFANETALEDVIKYIKTATTAPGLEQGIPIYIDPSGLSESEKTMASPVTLNLDGVPLRSALKLILGQIDLTYTVKDGLLTITSPKRATQGDEAPIDRFQRAMHCLWAIAFAAIGGLAGRRAGRRRDP